MVPKRLRQEIQVLAHALRSSFKKGISIVQDPIQVWNLGLEVNLRLNSRLRILPITLSPTEEDQIRADIRVPTSAAYVPYLVNLMIALRIAFFVWMNPDKRFKLLAQGQFTKDATLFFIGLLISSIPYGMHSTLLRVKHDFAFLGNSVLKMNRQFAGMHFFY